MNLFLKLITSALFVAFIIILSWVLIGKKPINEIVSPVYISGLIVLILPIIVLIFKDAYFKKKGMSQNEINLKSIIWLIFPFSIIISLLILYIGWSGSNKDSQVGNFLLGCVASGIFGLWVFFKIMSSSKKHLSNVKQGLTIAMPIILISLIFFRRVALPLPIEQFIENHKYALQGGLGILIFFASLSHLLLALRKKFTLFT